jgi:hypothetical protein
MTLHEIIQSIDAQLEEATIFAERINGEFLPESRTVIIELTDDELSKPVKEVAASRAPGTDYFLEVFVAKEAMEGWQEYRQGEVITPKEMTDVVIYYAENDAWPMSDAG